jgi:hypothetical protein
MSRLVRIPRHANVTNAIPGLGIDMRNGALTILGVVMFFVLAIVRHMWAGFFVLVICYIANRIYLDYKKEAIPGFWSRFLYRIGTGGYAAGLLGRHKKYLGDGSPVWAGIAAAVKKKSEETNTWNC